MFFYLPLEPYKERYTCLLSSKDGWIENKLKQRGIEFKRIEGKSLGNAEIKSGQVLDCHRRAYWSLTQVAEAIFMIKTGWIKDGDILYFDDFWTPGMEAIPYVCDVMGIKVKIYAMLHAQSVDKFDFTYKMKSWLRHFEIGQSKFMAGIFVTSEYLMDLCLEAGLENIYYGGLPYNKQWILDHFPIVKEKQDQVIYSSRFDKEKNPLLFVKLASLLKKKFKFVMTTSAKEIRSNSPFIVKKLKEAQKKGIVEIKVGLTKKQYYQELQKSKYQVNTALQDWVSWTMLEAITYGCIPVYPRYRSFPETLRSEYLYDPKDPKDMAKVIFNNELFDNRLMSIPDWFDKSVDRYLKIMGL